MTDKHLRGSRVAGAILVLVLLCAFAAIYLAEPGVLLRRAAALHAFAAHNAWLFVGLFLLRLLFLLPVSAVLLLTGAIYGVRLGELVAVAGLTLSGSAEFLLARTALRSMLRLPGPMLQRWQARLDRAPFQAVLLMRVCFVPFDLVNVMAAVGRVRLAPFVCATVLGVVPAAFPVVLLGASIDLQSWFAGDSLLPAAASLNGAYVAGAILYGLATIGLVRLAPRLWRGLRGSAPARAVGESAD